MAIAHPEPEFQSPPSSVRAVAREQEVVVVGAGPYGLAAAAHLGAAGVDVRAFGEPMESWERHMPDGMLLRSRWDASHIADPDHALGLDAYEQEHGLERAEPVPVERFIAYGRWFQERAVPQLERRRVSRVSRADRGGFEVELDDGERLRARKVVVAGGIVPFATRPEAFSGLGELVSHAADHPSLDVFAGRRVAVVGGGQSATESAALLAEAGADVELLLRAPGVRWLAEGDQINVDRQPRRFHAYSKIALGGPEASWLIALPAAWPWIPRRYRVPLSLRIVRPAAAGWLRPRLDEVPIIGGCTVESAERRNGMALLRLADGTTRDFEHVLLATGYRVDVTRYPFVDPALASGLRVWNGHPVLRNGFESSVPGLHFIGASALPTFGPVMRFVCGTWATARGLTRGIVGRRARRAGFSW